jgi:CsoR family transcriptional regulator, copper-sensing transcriptional repressor
VSKKCDHTTTQDRVTGPGGHAHAVDADEKKKTLHRLRRIEGQVRGLQRLVDEERYCPDILDQVASVEKALLGVKRALVRNHLEHCAHAALRSDDPARRDAMVTELLELWGR